MDQPEPEISLHRCTAKARTFGEETQRELDLLAELDAKREELAKLWEPDEWPRESAAHAGRPVRAERLAARIEELERIIREGA